jgi:YD repeat-containing protein
LIPTYCIVPAQTHVVTVVLADGTTYEFQPVLSPGGGCQQAAPLSQVTVSFAPTGSNTPPNASLAVAGNNQPAVDGSFPGAITLIDLDTSATFDPDQYNLTLPDGRVLLISRQLGLQTMTDLNGNTLTVSAGGITSSTGKSVAFQRDSQNRITQITDPVGNTLTYGYDANSDLTSFTDQLKNVSTYTYDDNHNLQTIVDPRGVQPIRNDYDADGRLVSHTDAFGNVINYSNNPNTKQETVTDRLGNVP